MTLALPSIMTDRKDSAESALSCSAVVTRAFEYLDGELPSAQLASLEEHVTRCPSCRRHLERERTFLRTLRAGMAGDPCPELVRERIREAMLKRREAQLPK